VDTQELTAGSDCLGVDEMILTNETGQYELQAVVTHRGRVADSGHYVAWVKSAQGWLRCDDEPLAARCLVCLA
jgi:uncharacterized UBP type Zn finger protein